MSETPKIITPNTLQNESAPIRRGLFGWLRIGIYFWWRSRGNIAKCVRLPVATTKTQVWLAWYEDEFRLFTGLTPEMADKLSADLSHAAAKVRGQE